MISYVKEEDQIKSNKNGKGSYNFSMDTKKVFKKKNKTPNQGKM
jgi:hypothetical protein